MCYKGGRIAQVDIATRLPHGQLGLTLSRAREYVYLHSVRTGSGAHPASCPLGTGGAVPGVKWQGHEADQLPTSIAEMKNGGAIPLLRHMPSWHIA
jgi:hypothetical protein